MVVNAETKSFSDFSGDIKQTIQSVIDSNRPLMITENGELQAVLLDAKSYHSMQDQIALLKIFALSRDELKSGKGIPVREAFQDLKNRLRQLEESQ